MAWSGRIHRGTALVNAAGPDNDGNATVHRRVFPFRRPNSARMQSMIMTGFYQPTPNYMSGVLEDVAGGIAAVAAAAGSLLGAVSNWLGGISPSTWDHAGAGVHQWFTDHGEDAFLAWMRANRPDGFASLDTVLALLCLYKYESIGQIIRPDEADVHVKHWYKAGVTETAYQILGIDYQASLDTLPAIGEPNFRTPTPWVFLATDAPVPGGGGSSGGGGRPGGGGGGGKDDEDSSSSSLLIPLVLLLAAGH